MSFQQLHTCPGSHIFHFRKPEMLVEYIKIVTTSSTDRVPVADPSGGGGGGQYGQDSPPPLRFLGKSSCTWKK